MPDEIDPEEPGQSRASREAARYRTALREAEARITQLEGNLGALQSRVLQDAMKGKLIDPGDFEKFVARESIVDEHGNLDGEKVKASLEALVKEKPHLAVPAEPAPRTAPPGKQQPAKGFKVPDMRRPPEGRKSLEEQFGTDGQRQWSDVLNRRSELNEEAREQQDDAQLTSVTGDGSWSFDFSLGQGDDGGDGVD